MKSVCDWWIVNKFYLVFGSTIIIFLSKEINSNNFIIWLGLQKLTMWGQTTPCHTIVYICNSANTLSCINKFYTTGWGAVYCTNYVWCNGFEKSWWILCTYVRTWLIFVTLATHMQKVHMHGLYQYNMVILRTYMRI